MTKKKKIISDYFLTALDALENNNNKLFAKSIKLMDNINEIKSVLIDNIYNR